MAESTSETPVLDLLARHDRGLARARRVSIAETLVLVRIAALVAVDAPPVSYLLNLEAAGEVGIDAEQVRGVLAAIAPIVGTARVASATGNIVEALEVAIEIDETSKTTNNRPGWSRPSSAGSTRRVARSCSEMLSAGVLPPKHLGNSG